MLGYTPAHAVNYAALRIGIENHVSSLRADQIKGGFMALKDIGLALDVVFGHDCAVSIKALVASEAVSRRHRSCGFGLTPTASSLLTSRSCTKSGTLVSPHPLILKHAATITEKRNIFSHFCACLMAYSDTHWHKPQGSGSANILGRSSTITAIDTRRSEALSRPHRKLEARKLTIISGRP